MIAYRRFPAFKLFKLRGLLMLPLKSIHEYGEKCGILGYGSFGYVYRFSSDVAVKRIQNEDKEVPASTIREITALLRVQGHENIVRLYDVYIDQIVGGDTYLVMELCKPFSVANITNLDQCLNYFRQMVTAVTFCHDNHVTHRDIKPENFLFRDDDTLVLTDFGLASFLSDCRKTHSSDVITLYYRAPEVLMGAKNYDYGVDIWSLGVLLYLMLCNCLPNCHSCISLLEASNPLLQLECIFKLRGVPTEETYPEIKEMTIYDLWQATYCRWSTEDQLEKGFQGHLQGELLELCKSLLCINPRHRIKSNELRHASIFQNKIPIVPCVGSKRTFPIAIRSDPLRIPTFEYIRKIARDRHHTVRSHDVMMLLVDSLPAEAFSFSVLPKEHIFFFVAYVCWTIGVKLNDRWTFDITDLLYDYKILMKEIRVLPYEGITRTILTELELHIYRVCRFNFDTVELSDYPGMREHIFYGTGMYSDLLERMREVKEMETEIPLVSKL